MPLLQKKSRRKLEKKRLYTPPVTGNLVTGLAKKRVSAIRSTEKYVDYMKSSIKL